MSYLPCDFCGKETETRGSWSTLVTITCSKCSEKAKMKKPISQEEAFQILMDDVYSGKLDPSDTTIEVVINPKLQKLERELQDEQLTLHKLTQEKYELGLMIDQLEENIKNKKEEIEKEKNS